MEQSLGLGEAYVANSEILGRLLEVADYYDGCGDGGVGRGAASGVE